MGIVTSLPCCVERSRETRQLHPAKVVSTKISNILTKLGTLDEFSETVRQLNSPLPLAQPNPTFQHPWAKPPASVAAQGALIMAARIRNSKDANLPVQYWKSGCVTPLLNLLISGKDEDKVHAAVIALQALTDNCAEEELLDEIVQLDGLAIICKWMKASTAAEGVRMTSASISRNVVGRNKQYKTEFIRLGGLKAIVPLLELDKRRIADEQYTQWILERVNDIRDLLDNGTDAVDETVGKILIAEGAPRKLEQLRESSDNDIIEDSIDVINLLAKLN
jgi:hypothetical protein